MLLINKSLLLSLLLSVCTFGATTTCATIDAKIFRTPKNIEVMLLPDETTDLVSCAFGFKGAGAIADAADKAGLGYIMMELLFRSNANGMDRHSKARKIKELGILSDIRFAVTDDDIQISFKAPQENLPAALDMLNTMLFKAELNNTELNKIKAFGTSNTNLANAQEESFAWHALRNRMFNGHPYANPATGTEQGIQALTLDDIKSAFTNRLAKDNLIVAIVGNVAPNKIATYIDNTFANLPPQANLPIIAEITPLLDKQTKIIFKDSPQSTAIFAQQSLPYNHPDFYPLLLLNRILGGEPFTSRLWLEIREKLGLVYNIETVAHADIKLADIMIGQFKCNNKDVAQVLQSIKEQWLKIKTSGVSHEEFTAAKTGLIGKYALNFISPEETCAYLLANRLLGFDIQHINERNDKIKAITIADVKRVAAEHIQPEQLTFIVIGNPDLNTAN